MSFRCLFAKSRHGVLSCLDTLPNRPDWWSAAERVVFLQGCPLSTQQELELCQREHWLLGPSLPIARIGWMACFSKSPADSRLLPFMDDGGHHVNVLTEIFNAAAIFFYRSPDLWLNTTLTSRTTDNSLDFFFLVCAPTCTINYGTLHRQACTFPNHV